MNTARVTKILFLVLCAVPQLKGQADSVQTRFGELEVSQQRVLTFKGIPVEPRIQANNRLDIGRPFRIGDSDVALVTDEGGTACPFLYHFVSLRRSGATATKAFGTCNELTSVRREGDSIIVTMQGYQGPFEPPAERRRAMAEKHSFVFRNGTVTETPRTAHSRGASDHRKD